MDLKVFQGSEQVLGQSFGMKSRTVIAPVQVDDNAKLEFFEIDHRYSEGASINGVSVHFNYHSHARVTYPGASYDPTGTDVEATASVAGVEAGNEELSQAEFDLSFDSKPKADKIFAAEVDKVIKALEAAEKNWMTPNKCAQITSPRSQIAETAEKGQTGHVRRGSQIGGWRQARLRHLDGPETGERHVHPDDRALQPGEIQLHGQKSRERNLHRNHAQIVSAAGVAEKDWIQPTEPDEINHVTGTFTVRVDANGSIEDWSGEATYDRLTPGLSGSMGVYTLASGEATAVFSGLWGGGGGT